MVKSNHLTNPTAVWRYWDSKDVADRYRKRSRPVVGQYLRLNGIKFGASQPKPE